MTGVVPRPSESSVAEALARFASVVGEDAVRSASAGLAEFSDPYPMGPAEDWAPAGAVSPGSVEEVQAVLRIANELRVPLWTVSTGRNLGYGGPGPRVAGSVVLSLARMNRVLEINEQSAYALVEPGVRFFDLYEALRAGGHRLWPSVPDLGWGSVVGNALERGVGYTPYGDHNAMSCGLEVVLPDGDLLRTGMGAMTNSASWQLYKPGFGPAVDGLFAQSNLGVVTKMGIWLMPTPESYMVCEVKAKAWEDLAPLVDTLRVLILEGAIQSSAFICEPLGIAARVARRDRWYDGDGAMPDAIVARIMDEFGIGHWTLFFGLYGHEAIVDARFDIVKRRFEAIPGVSVGGTRYAGDADPEDVEPFHRTSGGIPGMLSLPMVDWRAKREGLGGHSGFSPVSPLRGSDALRQAQLIKSRAAEHGFDYMGAFHAGPRYMNHIFELIWDAGNAEQIASARALFTRLVKEAAADGHGEYRTHVAFMDLVADQYDFNDHALRRFTEAIKDTVDPNGILSPGKSGIWPAGLRNGRG
jgi:4-cresol dehydrogenase (hydroxylating)